MGQFAAQDIVPLARGGPNPTAARIVDETSDRDPCWQPWTLLASHRQRCQQL